MTMRLDRVADKESRIFSYLKIARPDHWFKNVFMLPGTALGLALADKVPAFLLPKLILGILATCLIASANYTINEWLDAEFDRHHPIKKNRPSVSGKISPLAVYFQWGLLASAGLIIAAQFSTQFFVAAGALLVMGLVYNVRPLRTKERQYLDVLSEAINNPLRLVLGWAIVVPSALPPSSALLVYWMGGAFLMAIKRYSEYQFIGDPQQAALYRKSFKYYTSDSLLLSAFFYALTSAFFLGVFLVKYRIEFILCLPLFSFLFVWYMYIGLKSASIAQTPEKLYKEWQFLAFVGLLAVVVGMLFFIDMPWLHVLVEHHVLGFAG